MLEPLQIPSRPWESISLDFIVGLPRWVIWGASSWWYRFSKYGIFIPTPRSCNAEMAAQLFITNVVKYWGVPQLIVSDETLVSQAGFGQNCLNCSGQHLNSPRASPTDGWTYRASELVGVLPTALCKCKPEGLGTPPRGCPVFVQPPG